MLEPRVSATRWFIACAAAVACAATAQSLKAPDPVELRPNVWLIPGTFPEGRQPDGNTIIFRGDSGLVVMDTGRHDWHAEAILDFARDLNLPITAIINSHWHLDHTSGNAAIKQIFPSAPLITGTAVNRMIRDIWPESLQRSQAFLDSGKASPGMAADVRRDIETRQNPDALAPDDPVTASGTRTIDGLSLQIHLAPNAATDGDVWVYEPRSRIAATGDLLTLPVPFLDTACIKGWRAALNRVAQVPFVTVVPGHGAPMDRAAFTRYKTAFEAFTDCAAGNTDKATCAADWAKNSATLRAPESADDPRTLEMAQEYVEFLRENGGNAKLCSAPAS